MRINSCTVETWSRRLIKRNVRDDQSLDYIGSHRLVPFGGPILKAFEKKNPLRRQIKNDNKN